MRRCAQQILPSVVALTALCAPMYGECDRSPILVRDVAVWNGRSLDRGRNVLFRDGRLVSVRRGGADPSGGRVLDGSGHTLLPGLIDMHLHFSIPGLPKDVRDFQVSGRQMLRYGVTAGRLHLASLQDAGEVKRRGADPCAALPRVQVGGPGLGGGAPDLNGAAFAGVRDPDDARSKVERISRSGLDWVAIHDIDRFQPAERIAILASARDLKLRVFSSATTPSQWRESLKARADTVDYGDLTEAQGYAPELLAALRKNRSAAVVPTFGIFTRYAAYLQGEASLDDPALYEFLDPGDAARVRARAESDLRKSDYVRSSAKFLPSLGRKLRELIETGIPVAIGTDVGSPAHLHAGAIWWEMETWRRHGVATGQVLRAATAVPARVLRLKDAGRLAPGARADFVLYRGDVTNGPFDAARVLAVCKGGVLFVSGGRWVGDKLGQHE